ncbi:hypothetical protein N7499_003075 [Penicillium canescens]|nr:hypothetical protein N7499_003075 [Penicillium canescens]
MYFIQQAIEESRPLTLPDLQQQWHLYSPREAPPPPLSIRSSVSESHVCRGIQRLDKGPSRILGVVSVHPWDSSGFEIMQTQEREAERRYGDYKPCSRQKHLHSAWEQSYGLRHRRQDWRCNFSGC